MDHLTPPEWVTRTDGIRLAVRRFAGKGPTLVFLPGYMSDMQGSKAKALEAFAIKHGRPMLRLDYSGCGESDGAFEVGTIEVWRDDILLVVSMLVRGPVVLVGSSMGGWLMLLVALALGDQVKGLVGIAAAPDFTEWGFSAQEKGQIAKYGRIERPSEYGSAPMVTTSRFWQSGHDNQLLTGEIAIDCPLRLIHGQNDPDVPWQISLDTAANFRSADVQTLLIKDGDHRLSRDQDIALILRVVENLLEAL